MLLKLAFYFANRLRIVLRNFFINDSSQFIGHVRVGDYVVKRDYRRFLSSSPKEFLEDFVKVE